MFKRSMLHMYVCMYAVQCSGEVFFIWDLPQGVTTVATYICTYTYVRMSVHLYIRNYKIA